MYRSVYAQCVSGAAPIGVFTGCAHPLRPKTIVGGKEGATSTSRPAGRAAPSGPGRRDRRLRRHPGAPRHNLPVELTSFVGRERAIVELRELLAAHRLVTLTGSGGCGKTRLALRVASDVAASYRDGVWLVALAPLADGALLPQAVLRALGATELDGQAPAAALPAFLRGRDLLLVLDNCEHIVGACAHLAEALLRACPRLRLLATGRELLGVPGEVAWRVPSLGVPTDDAAPPAALVEHEAVRLFVDRAREARPGFALDAGTAPAVARICRRLDGIPLAVELAAARARMLPVAEIAARLDEAFGPRSGRFRLLTDGGRTAPRRHQTLRALVDWSHDLLTEPERALLRRLSVFAGGWTLEAAEAVCADAPTPLAEDVLGTLTALVDKSLVLATEEGGRARYGLLETIRAYAAERLGASGEDAAVRGRHAAWCLDLARRAAAALDGPDRPTRLARLEREHDNLRAALRWSSANGDPADHLGLLAALARFWFVHGHLAEGRRWVDGAIAAGVAEPAVRAALLHGAGLLARAQGAYDDAERFLGEALSLAEERDDRAATAALLHDLGRVAFRRGHYPRSAALLERGLALDRAGGQPLRQTETLRALSELARLRGDPARAVRLAEAALEAARAMDAGWLVGAVLGVLGAALLRRDDLARAEEVLMEARACLPGAGDPRGALEATFQLTVLALRRGDAARAEALLRESLAQARAIGSDRDAVQQLEAAGWLSSEERRPERAARLLGAGDALRRTIRLAVPPVERPERERVLAAVRANLAPAAFAAAWRAGAAMSRDEALADALADGADDLRTCDPPAAGPLTPREREVAALVARGFSNRRVAEALVIAPGTAQRHVANILAKLDVSSRARIAAWAVEHGLVAAE
jgi:predicted ATPase/DNA-binding CsgD family transcriptional regulator